MIVLPFGREVIWQFDFFRTGLFFCNPFDPFEMLFYEVSLAAVEEFQSLSDYLGLNLRMLPVWTS